MSDHITFKVDPSFDGKPIENLFQAFYTPTKTMNHLLNKKVMIQDAYIKPKHILNQGDVITIDFTGMIHPLTIGDVSDHISILYEDEHVVIVDKPVNLLVYDDGMNKDDLTRRVNRYFQKKGDVALANQYLEMAKTYIRFFPETQDANIFSIFTGAESDRQRYIKTLEAVYPHFTKVANMWP